MIGLILMFCGSVIGVSYLTSKENVTANDIREKMKQSTKGQEPNIQPEILYTPKITLPESSFVELSDLEDTHHTHESRKLQFMYYQMMDNLEEEKAKLNLDKEFHLLDKRELQLDRKEFNIDAFHQKVQNERTMLVLDQKSGILTANLKAFELDKKAASLSQSINEFTIAQKQAQLQTAIQSFEVDKKLWNYECHQQLLDIVKKDFLIQVNLEKLKHKKEHNDLNFERQSLQNSKERFGIEQQKWLLDKSKNDMNTIKNQFQFQLEKANLELYHREQNLKHTKNALNLKTAPKGLLPYAMNLLFTKTK